MMADASALWKLGRDSRDQDHLDEAIGYFEQALAGFRQLGKLAEQEEVLDDLGNVYRDYGTVQRSNELREKGIACFRESLSIAQRLGDRSGQAVSLGNLGLGYYSLRDLDPAIDYLEQSAAMFRVLGDRAQLGRTLAYLGRAQEKAVGRGEEGMDTLRQSITILREVGDRSPRRRPWTDWAAPTAPAVAPARRWTASSNAGRSTRNSGKHRLWADSTATIGRLFKSACNKAAARDYLQQALAVLEELGVPEALNVRAQLNVLDAFP